jgi:hypothetical protein
MEDTIARDIRNATRAILLLHLQAHAQPDQPEKPEVLLARAGFGSREIAEMLGKKQAAVVKTLQRAGRAA